MSAGALLPFLFIQLLTVDVVACARRRATTRNALGVAQLLLVASSLGVSFGVVRPTATALIHGTISAAAASKLLFPATAANAVLSALLLAVPLAKLSVSLAAGSSGADGSEARRGAGQRTGAGGLTSPLSSAASDPTTADPLKTE